MKRNLFYCCLFVVLLSLQYSCNDDNAQEDLMGFWEPHPEIATDMTWESSAPVVVNDLSMSTPEIAGMSTQFANTLLPAKVRAISFRKDNKLEVTYINDETGYLTTEVFGTYRMINRSKFTFSPDISKFAGVLDGMSATMREGIKLYATAGISVQYYYIGNNTEEIRFYLTMSTLKESRYLFPFLAAAILGKEADNTTIQSMLESVPAHLEKTSKIELGFNFYKLKYFNYSI